MGMSIERAHEILSNGLVHAPSEHEWCVAFKMAIDVMYKYQKIQEVMDSRPDDDAKSNSKALGEIEVIMYGTDD